MTDTKQAIRNRNRIRTGLPIPVPVRKGDNLVIEGRRIPILKSAILRFNTLTYEV